MADRLQIVLVNTDPSNPSELGAPFFQASVAAAMGYEVEIIITGRAGELVKKGVAETIQVNHETHKSAMDFIREATNAGVRLKVCTPTIELWGGDLIEEVDETVGAAYVISQAMDGETITFTY